MRKKIIIDCDPGTDDALTIAMALADPNIEILGITTVAGNREVEKTTINALKTLEYFDRIDIPVYRGSPKPLQRELFTLPEAKILGKDGLGDCDLPNPKITPRGEAVEFITEQLGRYPKEVTILAIGPLTNIARVLNATDPTLIGQLYLMNGAFWAPGNITEYAEFNAYVDPEAAEIVYKADIPTKVVGLDVTNPVVITRKEFERLRDYNTPEAKFFIKINENPISREKKDAFSIFWDAIAFTWLVDPRLIRSKRGRVRVETGEKRGMTRFNEGEGNIEVGSTIDVTRFFNFLYQFFNAES